MSEKTGHTSLSEFFEMLSNECRRRVLTAVGEANPRDEEEIKSVSIADEESAKPLAVLQQELYHTHLPKLNDAGFINWDRNDGIITQGPRFEEVEPLLRLMQEHQDELPDDWP